MFPGPRFSSGGQDHRLG
ncbi:hypothetical protein E2C01_083179 [Portunus trituberculatus]|uniref:Uncharacterized protein n=1 Tax=Portunus trituberculatus TaxID=210409 RepID=A0A5B7J122_PORTR|nr:hypothetical protein [Portunus trituberculatus]